MTIAKLRPATTFDRDRLDVLRGVSVWPRRAITGYNF